jgi:hypothetical protein
VRRRRRTRGGDRRRRLGQRCLERRAPRRRLEALKRRTRARAGVIARGFDFNLAQRIGRQRRVVRAVRRRRRHQRAQSEAPGEVRLHAQARVLARRVLGDVVEPPVRFSQRPLPLRDRVTELVKHQLRKGIVVVQHVVHTDRDLARAVAGRVCVACARHREADALRGTAPDGVNVGRGERAGRFHGRNCSGEARRRSMLHHTILRCSYCAATRRPANKWITLLPWKPSGSTLFVPYAGVPRNAKKPCAPNSRLGVVAKNERGI